jgi:hypothetical protein
MAEELKLVEVTVKGRELTVGTETFDIHRITNFELEHDEKDDARVRAYVGYSDPTRRRPLFATQAPVDRKFVGSVDSEDLERVRDTFRSVGVPLLEL